MTGIINIAAQLTIVKTSKATTIAAFEIRFAGHSPANIFDLNRPAEDLSQQVSRLNPTLKLLDKKEKLRPNGQ